MWWQTEFLARKKPPKPEGEEENGVLKLPEGGGESGPEEGADELMSDLDNDSDDEVGAPTRNDGLSKYPGYFEKQREAKCAIHASASQLRCPVLANGR